LVLVLPGIALSHPGKTDRYGGHKCLRKCEDWGLVFDEYHLHDKEGRPVRVAQKREVQPEPAAPAERAAEASSSPQDDGQAQQQPQEQDVISRYITVTQEESIVPRSPLVFVLLVLLALLLILRLGNGRREKK
jgi:hypothetical protein